MQIYRVSVDVETFRSLLGRFASGVTVVTLRDAEGRDHGLTVTAFASLSLEPPLVLVCIDRAASIHDAFTRASTFAVNILAADQEPLARRFAAAAPADRFEGVGFARGATGAPLLDDALAHLECRVTQRVDGGDHSIFLGEIEAGASARHGLPLLYYRGGYAEMER
jgi:flavin reductase (DIM6/NTAB) family NADH-FMN oxidoreductase RutF